MKFRTVALAAAISAMPVAHAAEIIRFSPGPLDGVKIQTSWGDFVAVRQGNSIWVGTQQEYDHAQVLGILKSQGMIEVPGEGNGPNDHTIINVSALRTAVGATQVYEIWTQVLFDEKPSKKLHRPAKPNGQEYVSVTWQQSAAGNIRASILNTQTSVAYQPYDCTAVDGFHDCEFLVPYAALGSSMSYVFTRSMEKPAVLPVGSIAKADYATLQESVGSGRYKRTPSEDQLKQAARLHEIDPTIPSDL